MSPHRPRLRRRAALAVLPAVMLVAASAAVGSQAQARTTAAPASAQAPTTRACSTPSRAGLAACAALIRTDIAPMPASAFAAARAAHTARSLAGAGDVSPLATPSGLGPADLQSAYALPSATAGAGRTVAIVDAFDDPNAEADLAVYRSQFGLPACTTANGCFRKVNQNGGTTPPRSDVGWAEEISLDLDMVSAICPNCNILLVEATSNSLANLGAAVNRAATMGAVAISNSYGADESASELTSDSQFYNHPGIAVTASSGDSGFGVSYPAASRFVTAVGGTSLTASSNARGWTETVWSGAGSGCSAFEAKPSWQTDTGCSRRTVADVSAVADPATGVAVFDSFGVSGWLVFGGTSVSAPIIASVYALAGTPTAGSTPSSYPYAHTSALFDVVSGSNGSCSTAYLCRAATGYDGPTGLGTPNGATAFAP